jgi:hypothetical protein
MDGQRAGLQPVQGCFVWHPHRAENDSLGAARVEVDRRARCGQRKHDARQSARAFKQGGERACGPVRPCAEHEISRRGSGRMNAGDDGAL